MSLATLTLDAAARKLREREITSVELTEAVLERIQANDARIQAYITVDRDGALEQARAADNRLRAGAAASPLLGVPIALKDNLLTAGLRTTCASAILREFVPYYDATVVRKLRSGGAVILGKTNLDEFAMGSSAENSAFFPTRNPWNLGRVPGGSSGGSAAAVAASECIAALGTDTGGSIRQPAACCGIVGLKPTYGRVSRYGVIAFASSMDQVGPMTRDVRDAALLLETVAGHDPADATSAHVGVPEYAEALTGDIDGIRIGVPKEYFANGMEPAITDALQQALREFERSGAEIEEISLPHTDYAVAVYYVAATAEASSNLARYDGMRFGYRAEAGDLNDTYTITRDLGFGPEVKRRILLGTYALSAGYYDAYYLKAQRVRVLIRRDFELAFERCDVIATPTMPSTAFALGAKTQDPLQMYLSDIFTISANLAGLPALSLPCGFAADGMPIGIQLIGKPFEEETILRVAHRYEQSSDWHNRQAPDTCP